MLFSCYNIFRFPNQRFHQHFQNFKLHNLILFKRVMSEISKKPKVYITRRIPAKGLELLQRHCIIEQWDDDAVVPRQELLSRVYDKDALFCLLTDPIDKEVIDKAGKSLKVIGTMSVGYDHIDLQTCKNRGILVGYTPDVLTDAAAEFTVGLLLSVARNIVKGVGAVHSGEWGTWAPLWMCGYTLTGATVGIVGFGRIGRVVAKRLKGFDVKTILYTGTKPKDDVCDATFVSFDELLDQSDFVIVTCALTAQTKGLFDKVAFSKMKPTAIFVNTSRGGVVNQTDLYDALVSGQIAGAGLDVTTPEPLPTDSELLKLSNCVVTPHICSATMDTRNAMSELCARNILAALNDKTMPAQVKIF